MSAANGNVNVNGTGTGTGTGNGTLMSGSTGTTPFSPQRRSLFQRFLPAAIVNRPAEPKSSGELSHMNDAALADFIRHIFDAAQHGHYRTVSTHTHTHAHIHCPQPLSLFVVVIVYVEC